MLSEICVRQRFDTCHLQISAFLHRCCEATSMICIDIVTFPRSTEVNDLWWRRICYTFRIVEDTWYLNIYETLVCIGDLSSVRSGQKDNFNRVNGKIFRCLLIGGFRGKRRDAILKNVRQLIFRQPLPAPPSLSGCRTKREGRGGVCSWMMTWPQTYHNEFKEKHGLCFSMYKF